MQISFIMELSDKVYEELMTGIGEHLNLIH